MSLICDLYAPYMCLICVLIYIGLLAARESLQMACGVGGFKHDPRQNPGSPYVCLVCALICALNVPYVCLMCALYVLTHDLRQNPGSPNPKP